MGGGDGGGKAQQLGTVKRAENVVVGGQAKLAFVGGAKSSNKAANLLFAEQLVSPAYVAKLVSGEPPKLTTPGRGAMATPRTLPVPVSFVKDRHYYGFNPMGYETSLDHRGANYGSQGRWPGLNHTPPARRALVQRNTWQLKGKSHVLPAGVWTDFPPMEVGPGEDMVLFRKRADDFAATRRLHASILRQGLQKQAFETRKQNNQARYGSSVRAASAGPSRRVQAATPVLVQRDDEYPRGTVLSPSAVASRQVRAATATGSRRIDDGPRGAPQARALSERGSI